MNRETVIVVPAEVVLVYDAEGWHVEAQPLGFDMERQCDLEDAMDR